MGWKRKTVKISIIGLDGVGKSTTVSNFTKRFSSDLFVIKMGRSVYYYNQESLEKVRLFEKLLSKIDKRYEKYEKKGSRLGIAWASIVYVISTRFMESKIFRKFKPDVIINSRDIIIDALVYADYYLPLFRFLPERLKVFLLRIFSLFPKKSDLVIFLNLDPCESINRIKKREKKCKIDPSVMRIKSRYRHENLESLIKISERYHEVLSKVNKDSTVIDYDINNKHNREVTDYCAKVIKSYIKSRKGDE